jgi:hypothetical protein
MLGKCVLSVSGIVTKQLIKVDHHNGIDFYMTRQDYNNPYSLKTIYFQYDDHFFPVSKGQGDKIEKLKAFLDKNPNFDLHKWITEQFEDQLKTGQYVNKGYAQYFGREKEAQEAVERFRKQQEAKKAEQQAKEVEEERRRKIEYENQVTESEQMYKNNKFISSEMFIALCQRYNIKIPPKTKGWINNELVEIVYLGDGRTKYRYRNAKSKSNSVFDIAEKLYEAIKADI